MSRDNRNKCKVCGHELAAHNSTGCQVSIQHWSKDDPNWNMETKCPCVSFEKFKEKYVVIRKDGV